MKTISTHAIKRVLILALLLITSVISWGQKEDALPKPREVDKDYRKEYRQNLKEAKQYLRSDEAEDYPVTIPIEERVPVAKYGPNEIGTEDFTNWGKDQLLPPHIYQRLYDAWKYPVVVKVFDTSKEWTHPDLQKGQLPGSDYTGDNTSYDQGHGIHVNGIICGEGGGIAWAGVDKGLLTHKPVQVLNDQGSGTFGGITNGVNTEENENEDYQANGTVVIQNFSLGGGTGKYGPLEQAYFNSYKNGTINIAAAGNSGSDVRYPGNSQYTIAVSSIDQTLVISSFSSRGEEVVFCAPGRGITSTYKDDSYATFNGTSMATPFVVGLSAITYGVWGKDRIGDQDGLIAYLSKVATNLGPVGKDNLYGYGLVFVQAILDTPPDDSDGPDNPTCTDGKQNGNETGIDCGGPDCPPCEEPPTCNDGKQNGNETGVDCGGSCPPCQDEPGKVFPERVLPIRITGKYPVQWIEVKTNSMIPFTFTESGSNAFTAAGHSLIMNDYNIMAAQAKWVTITEIEFRTKSTEDAAITAKGLKQQVDQMWSGNRGVGLPYPADFDRAGSWASYFSDLLLDIKYGNYQVTVGKITFENEEGYSITYDVDELRHWPRGSEPFGYTNPTNLPADILQDYSIDVDLGSDGTYRWSSELPEENEEFTVDKFKRRWEVTATWYRDTTLTFGGGALPEVTVPYQDEVGIHTVRIEGGYPREENLNENPPFDLDWKVKNILERVKLNY